MGNKTSVGILTISDKGSQGLRNDESGTILVKIIEENGYSVFKKEIVPDDRRQIADKLSSWVDKDGLSL
ncbi:MAG: molybdenum cofactor biosynthesis protein, partial [Deltaproteobacteria bacterium]|nr:molybdenum cofactor biosynthesis protein [Deltaproteobacteria bacterium]